MRTQKLAKILRKTPLLNYCANKLHIAILKA